MAVPLNPLYAFCATDVSIVPLIYLLAVGVDKLSPELKGDVALLSVNPCASAGLYPCAESVSCIVLLLSPLGALGTALT